MNATRQPIPPGALWARRGSGTDIWYSFGQYAAMKRNNFWELTYAGKKIGADEYLQVAMELASLPTSIKTAVT